MGCTLYAMAYVENPFEADSMQGSINLAVTGGLVRFPPSQQKFEYIVFRGSDVKDIKIEEEPKESKQQNQTPDDPAILVCTSYLPSPSPIQ